MKIKFNFDDNFFLHSIFTPFFKTDFKHLIFDLENVKPIVKKRCKKYSFQIKKIGFKIIVRNRVDFSTRNMAISPPKKIMLNKIRENR